MVPCTSAVFLVVELALVVSAGATTDESGDKFLMRGGRVHELGNELDAAVGLIRELARLPLELAKSCSIGVTIELVSMLCTKCIDESTPILNMAEGRVVEVSRGSCFKAIDDEMPRR